jgi:hypothetical protein
VAERQPGCARPWTHPHPHPQPQPQPHKSKGKRRKKRQGKQRAQNGASSAATKAKGLGEWQLNKRGDWKGHSSSCPLKAPKIADVGLVPSTDPSAPGRKEGEVAASPPRLCLSWGRAATLPLAGGAARVPLGGLPPSRGARGQVIQGPRQPQEPLPEYLGAQSSPKFNPCRNQ